MTQTHVNFLSRVGHHGLSPAQIDFLAARGGWFINAQLMTTPMGQRLEEGDPVAFAGQGVADLNKIQKLMDIYPWGRFSVDVGKPQSFSEFIFIGTNDIIAWRTRFIELWGTVNRPQYWSGDVQSVNGSASIGTIWP